MKAIIALVVFAFLFLSVFAFPISAANLLLNPSFEDGINYWILNGTTATFSAISDVKHSGNFAASLSKKNSSSWAYFYQRVNVEAGKYYKLSGWVRFYDDYINNIKLRFYWLSDSSGTKLISNPIETTTQTKNSDFQFLQTDANLAPDNTLFAEVQGYVYLNTANPANPSLFDDFTFELSDPPTSTPVPKDLPTPTNKLTNTPTPTISNTPTVTKVISKTPTPTIDKSLPTQTQEVLAISTKSSKNTLDNKSETSNKTEDLNTNKNNLISIILISIGIVFLLLSVIVIAYPHIKIFKNKNYD